MEVVRKGSVKWQQFWGLGLGFCRCDGGSGGCLNSMSWRRPAMVATRMVVTVG